MLGDDDGVLAARIFGVTDTGNFEGGTTVLSQPFPIAQVARSLDVEEAGAARCGSTTSAPGSAWLGAREPPGAGARRQGAHLVERADGHAPSPRQARRSGGPTTSTPRRRCADFLLAELRPDGILLRTWKDGVAKITGLARGFRVPRRRADHPVRGVRRRTPTSPLLARIVDDALRRFQDGGVLYDTASDAEPLLVRPRTIDDNPIPAGQSVLASALLRAGRVHR